MESTEKTSFWASVALGSFTVISSIVGSNVEGFAWLLYFSALVLVTSFAVLIWEKFLRKAATNHFSRKRLVRNLGGRFGGYSKIIAKFRVLEEIDKSLSQGKIEWEGDRPYFPRSAQNSLSIIEHGLAVIPPEYRIVAANIALIEVVKSFDDWLRVCDGLLQNGKAKYKSEGAKNEVLHLMRRYYDVALSHDEFCVDTNALLGSGRGILVELYCQPHWFDWKNAGPDS